MADFATSVQAFVDKAKGNIDRQVRGITLALFRDVIMSTPVGDPKLWERNRVAVNYNKEVDDYNSSLKDDTANLDKRGYLKRGLKLNDGMDVYAPPGYVGGRLRGNWQVSIGEPITDAGIDRIDPSGASTVADAAANIGGAGTVTYMTNNVVYAESIEFGGHSKQAPEGMVRVNMARIEQIIKDTE